eukprot:g20579.t1
MDSLVDNVDAEVVSTSARTCISRNTISASSSGSSGRGLGLTASGTGTGYNNVAIVKLKWMIVFAAVTASWLGVASVGAVQTFGGTQRDPRAAAGRTGDGRPLSSAQRSSHNPKPNLLPAVPAMIMMSMWNNYGNEKKNKYKEKKSAILFYPWRREP